jgi:exonuclease III
LAAGWGAESVVHFAAQNQLAATAVHSLRLSGNTTESTKPHHGFLGAPAWMHDALFQPEPRSRYRALLELGYTDAFRSLHPGKLGQFTFWDYFRQAFLHNRGIRIDHFLLSPELAARLVACEIDRGPRALEKPSDHTPIILTLADLA